MSRTRISRREFLALSGTALAGVALAACQPQATPKPAEPTAPAVPTTAPVQPTKAPAATVPPATAAPTAVPPTMAPVSQYKEAPMLADLVKSGKLPAVDKRLPAKPLVMDVPDRPGDYGGTLRTALRGAGDSGHFTRSFAYDNLFHWNPDGSIVSHLADSWSSNPDFTEYTINLRKGLRWSDGEPYNADDILFIWEDIYNNKELFPGGAPSWLVAGSNPTVVQKVDDYTVKFKFGASNGFFIRNLATGNGMSFVQFPAHYVKQFHTKYNKDGIDALMKDAGAKTWVELWNKRAAETNLFTDAKRPVLWAWYFTIPYTGEATRVELARNPYYGVVDPKGNQLPYLDKIVFTRFEDLNVMTLSALNGEIDFQNRHFGIFQNKALFLENSKKGNFRLIDTSVPTSAVWAVNLNLNHKDPAMRKLFQSKDFRIALSYAVNREEINQTLYLGAAQPYQAAPRPGNVLYHEKLAKQYTEFDKTKAEDALKKSGCTRDASGKILRSDGKPVSFIILAEPAAWNADLELVVKAWRAFGIDVQQQQADRALINQKCDAWDLDAVAYVAVGGSDPINEPACYLPIHIDARYGRAWQAWWNTNGKGGEEPPDAVKQQFDLWAKLISSGDEKAQNKYMMQILDIAADQFYVIGLNLTPDAFTVAKNDFQNIPKSLTDSWPGLARSHYSRIFKAAS